MKIKVNITTNDITKGTPYDGCFCPVARAIKRTKLRNRFGFAGMFWVTANDGTSKLADIPISTQNWIKAFDNGRPVKPFSFILEVAD